MDWMLTRCEEVDEEGLSGNEADSEDEGYNDEIADPDNLLLNMVCCLICIWSVVFQQYAYFKNIFSFSVQCPCYVVWKLTPCVHLNVTTIKRYLMEQWSFNLKVKTLIQMWLWIYWQLVDVMQFVENKKKFSNVTSFRYREGLSEDSFRSIILTKKF